MLSLQFISLLLFLLYLWYMSGSHDDARVNRPTTQLDITELDNSFEFKEMHYGYQCSFANHTWNASMPNDYMFRPLEIRRKDPCFTVRDHGKVLATGSMLYEYLQNERLQSSSSSTQRSSSIEIDASTVFQDQKVFYFECMNKEISNLCQCPPGHVFRHNDCLPISICLDQKDGTVFPDPLNNLYYYQCFQSKLERKQCSSNTFFEHNGCKETDVQNFCQHNAFQMLDVRTLLVCRHGRATFETCPPGFRYFDNSLDSTEIPVCESDRCVGVANGQKKSLPTRIEHGLKYSPGFVTCQNNRIHNSIMCPPEWDTFSADHLLPLSQVFDETLQKCTAPQFCENVDPQDPQTIIVPVHEWTKHLPQWKYSTLMDQVTGYRCVSGTRTRTPLPAGQRINTQSMKMESACQNNSSITVVPISGDVAKYYDCATGTVMSCGNLEFFNGEACQKYTRHAFQRNDLGNIDLFTMDSLDADSWIKPWNYLTVPQPNLLQNNCRGNYVYSQLYHICIHKDCVLYPFLSQIDFFFGLRDGSTCEYDKLTRYLNKINSVDNEKYLYWTQRTTLDAVSAYSEPCQEGQHIQSGHVVFDKVIFATCDPKQPFVFCPSPLTTGISKVNDVFMCTPDRSLETTIMQPKEKRSFFKRELLQMTSPTRTYVKVNNQLQYVTHSKPFDLTPFNSDKSPSETVIEATDEAITLFYQYKISHPPNRVFRTAINSLEESWGPSGSGYVMKTGKFTKKSLNFPDYKFTYLLPNL